MLRVLRKKIGVIGYGNMGSAIAERTKAKYRVSVFDKDKEKTKNLKGINVTENIVGLVAASRVLILAVKPQDFDAVLNEIKEYLKGKLVISIAAGITTTYIEKKLEQTRVIRVMPNICAKIGKAETSLCKGKSAKTRDLDFVKQMFNSLGKTWIMDEGMIDAATAIVGSGPAYIYYDMEKNNIDPRSLSEAIRNKYIERLTEAAKRVGFDPRVASELAGSTTASSISLSAVSGIPPTELRKQITSQGGTTEAALKILIEGGSWSEAAEAAVRRAKELAEKE
jgi:pyrroline-5-carboxylate reductase